MSTGVGGVAGPDAAGAATAAVHRLRAAEASGSVVVAYRLYQDATRASELVALNGAPQPLFMPTSGKAWRREVLARH